MKSEFYSKEVTRLEDIPNIGPALAGRLRIIGVGEPEDLKGRSAAELYEKLNKKTGFRHDPCVLDVFMAAVDYVGGEPARPWWHYTKKRKSIDLAI